MANQELQALREQIDDINRQLVELINVRAAVAIEIGKAKQGGAIYDPAREATVLRAVIDLNHGPLPDEAIEAIFKEIIAACRAIQLPAKAMHSDLEVA